MSDDFILHERLAADTVTLDDWPLCRVLLMNDQSYHWLILVPRRPDLKETHALDSSARQQLNEGICRASRPLQTSFSTLSLSVGDPLDPLPPLRITGTPPPPS